MKTLLNQWKITLSRIGIAMIGLFFITSIFAQEGLKFELRPDANFATSKLAGADLNTGFGVEAVIAYHFIPEFGIYGGWGWHHFASETSNIGDNVDFDETGYTYGVQLLIPVNRWEKMHWFFRGGGLWNHIEAEDNEGDNIADSKHGFGWQGEAGVSFKITDHFNLRPSLRYRSLSREFDIDNSPIPANLRYLSFGLSGIWDF